MLASSRDRESVPPVGAVAAAGASTIRPPWESDEAVVPPWEDPARPNPAAPVRQPVSARSRPIPRPLRDRDESDPERRAVELAQRGRIILDVSIADLEVAEAVHGAFHPIAWHFRNACNEARRSWDRLRAELGTRTLEAALNQPPLVVMTLGGDSGQNGAAGIVDDRPRVRLLVIGGKTYCAQRVAGTALAPIQWRLTRPHPPLENGPYFACRLAGGATQCDCAEWTYQVAENPDARLGVCKHIAALASLGWI
ncbi:MAG: hypothetical protein ACYC61_28980 [Isosphaeraceae bacterium]